jgi:hypothetical protein
MAASEKERLGVDVENRWTEFREALFSNKRKYPVQRFKAFWEAGKRYAELSKSDPRIHRSVIGAVHGLTDFVQAERKRVPDHVPSDAQRLECLLFSGYDPYFEGEESPGL